MVRWDTTAQAQGLRRRPARRTQVQWNELGSKTWQSGNVRRMRSGMLEGCVNANVSESEGERFGDDDDDDDEEEEVRAESVIVKTGAE